MAKVLIVSRTRMHNGLCIGGFDLTTHRSLRLLPAGQNAQREDSSLQIGEVWELTYKTRDSAVPFSEDVDAIPVRRLNEQDVAAYVATHIDIAIGDTTALYDGMLHWNAGGKGFIEPNATPQFSTQFWKPTGVLYRNDGYKDGSSVFREAATNHKVPWVGVAAPPERIQPGTLVRMSLGRPWAGTADHPVCWLQLSGVY